jgi:hypothetical protein
MSLQKISLKPPAEGGLGKRFPHNRVSFGQRRLTGERNDEEPSVKAIHGSGKFWLAVMFHIFWFLDQVQRRGMNTERTHTPLLHTACLSKRSTKQCHASWGELNGVDTTIMAGC